MSGISGRDAGRRNVEVFESWIGTRRKADDWADYIVKGQLHRARIATQCGFAPTVVRQNPAVTRRLAELEDELRRQGVLIPLDTPAKNAAVEKLDDRRASIQTKTIATLQARVNQLNAEIVTLRARNAILEDDLTRHNLWERHLQETGRVVR
jgi:cell division protein FtsB